MTYTTAYLPQNFRTIAVADSMMLATYDTETYAGGVVYLHAAGEHWFQGERIGVIGSMTGHGQYATLGTPHSSIGYVPTENAYDWFVQRTSREEAIQEMVRRHMAH